jgi:hypothetical protein
MGNEAVANRDLAQMHWWNGYEAALENFWKDAYEKVRPSLVKETEK